MTSEFTVVIPLYNKAKYIARAIQSVESQTLPVKEIIIVDDGSTDNSVKCVRDLDIEYLTIISQPNQGVSVARNTGIKASKTDVVLLLDADDLWQPQFVQEINELVLKYPDAGMYATSYAFKEPNGRLVSANLKSVPTSFGYIQSYFAACLNADLPITASSVGIRKSAIEKVGYFPVGMKMGEDQLVWSRISYEYPIAFSNTVCAHYDRSIIDSACKTNFLTDLAPHISYWLEDLSNGKVPEADVVHLKKLLHLSLLYTVKNNLKQGRKAFARELLCSSPLAIKDQFWLIFYVLTFCPTKLFNRVF